MSRNKGLTEEDLELLLNESGSDYVPSDIEEDGYSSESEGEILDLREEVDVEQNSDNLPGPSTNQPGTSTHQIKGRNKKTNKPKINISWKSDNNFTPKDMSFDKFNSGVADHLQLDENSVELDYFKIFFDEDLLRAISKETNKYAKSLRDDVHLVSFSRWVDRDVSEMYQFFALCILMGLVEKGSLKDYWSTNPAIGTPFFRKICSRDNFLQTLYALHFADNQTMDKTDPLRKIRPIVDSMQTKFSNSFYPFQDLAIDESLILWKGRLVFKQYIPSKRHRFGVKLFEICDSETGYILGFIVYTGASTAIERTEKFGISGDIVLTLMKPYLNKNHILYVDNWYTSPILFKHLLEQQTGACGTVNPNRKGMPVFEQVEKGQCSAVHVKPLKWSDKRYVHMLTTVFTANQKDTGEIHFKTGESIINPECIIEYNNKMGAIDKADMQVSFVGCARKSLKWYKKVFFHLIDLSLYNSYVMFQVKTGEKPSFSDFRLKIVTQIIEQYAKKPSTMPRPPTIDNPIWLTQRHFPSPIPQTAAQGTRTQRRCHVCSNTKLQKRKRKDVKFMCVECDVPLCVHPCFADFHTKKKY
jgi:hypothetical protein